MIDTAQGPAEGYNAPDEELGESRWPAELGLGLVCCCPDPQGLSLCMTDKPRPGTEKTLERLQRTSEKSAGKVHNRIPLRERTWDISAVGTEQRGVDLHLNGRDFTCTRTYKEGFPTKRY